MAIVASDGELAFLNRAGDFYAREYGFPPVAGRLLAYLLICQPPEQTIAELSEALLASRSFQAGDLSLDHRSHFDAEVVALQQRLQGGNGARVSACAERQDAGHTNRKVRLAKIGRDLIGDVFVVFLEVGETGDGGVA